MSNRTRFKVFRQSLPLYVTNPEEPYKPFQREIAVSCQRDKSRSDRSA